MPPTAEWERLKARVAIDYRARQHDVDRGGKAIVTAGPPGVGKSSAIRQHDTSGYRRIDPDEIKDMLLIALERAGYLTERFEYSLPDGSPLTLRELSGWVHQASVDIADDLRLASLQDGENFVLEGALGWRPSARQYPQECQRWGYRQIAVIDMEAPVDRVLEQARQRWWDGRIEDMGGRFVPSRAIVSLYRPDGTTDCHSNALRLIDEARTLGLEASLDVYRRTPRGIVEHTEIRDDREAPHLRAVAAAPAAGGDRGRDSCVVCGRPLRSAASIARGAGPDCAAKLRT